MIRLRDIRPEDKEMIRNWRNLPDIARNMYTEHEITVDEHQKWFDAISGDPARRYWVITFNNEDVGLVNLYDIDNKNRRCSWAIYIVNTNAQRKGIGGFVEHSILKYVFDELKLNKLCCEVLAFNQPVIKAHKSFGFIEEGCFRQHVIKGGHPVDVVCFGILKEEWELIKPEVEKRLAKIEQWLRGREETPQQ